MVRLGRSLDLCVEQFPHVSEDRAETTVCCLRQESNRRPHSGAFDPRIQKRSSSTFVENGFLHRTSHYSNIGVYVYSTVYRNVYLTHHSNYKPGLPVSSTRCLRWNTTVQLTLPVYNPSHFSPIELQGLVPSDPAYRRHPSSYTSESWTLGKSHGPIILTLRRSHMVCTFTRSSGTPEISSARFSMVSA